MHRLGTGGNPRHLWSFKLNQTVLSLLAEAREDKVCGCVVCEGVVCRGVVFRGVF